MRGTALKALIRSLMSRLLLLWMIYSLTVGVDLEQVEQVLLCGRHCITIWRMMMTEWQLLYLSHEIHWDAKRSFKGLLSHNPLLLLKGTLFASIKLLSASLLKIETIARGLVVMMPHHCSRCSKHWISSGSNVHVIMHGLLSRYLAVRGDSLEGVGRCQLMAIIGWVTQAVEHSYHGTTVWDALVLAADAKVPLPLRVNECLAHIGSTPRSKWIHLLVMFLLS